MSQLFFPEKHHLELANRLAECPDAWVLICYCAAWCRTCAGFEQALEGFAQNHSEVVCIWVDIETHEGLLMQDDLDDLPTFLLQKKEHSYFYAPLPPMIGHIERLYEQGKKGLLPKLPDSNLTPFTQLLSKNTAS